MIESIEFKNFRALRDATLRLGQCNVLVGPNGSGKSTVLNAFDAFRGAQSFSFEEVVSAELRDEEEATVEVLLHWAPPRQGVSSGMTWKRAGASKRIERAPGDKKSANAVLEPLIARTRVFSLDASLVARPVPLRKDVELAPNGERLAAVLDRIRDHDEARFEALNEELGQWLPEFDRITFDLNEANERVFFLRMRNGGHEIPAAHVSQGSILALTLLTLPYLPEPPSLVGLEEPDRGIHPRLLRRVKDAIHRLAYPQSHGDDREPVQVIATTHSPYFLDLFREHPEEIVICEKTGQEVQFRRVSDLPNIDDILGDAPLGEAWYTGILGGVPSEP